MLQRRGKLSQQQQQRLCSVRLKTFLCFSVADKIEEAQKELEDPKGSQKGKTDFIARSEREM